MQWKVIKAFKYFICDIIFATIDLFVIFVCTSFF